MTNWIEHNGGPQPVGDDVWVELRDDHVPFDIHLAKWVDWGHALQYRILNEHLIDAKQVEIDTVAEAAILHRGIRLGVLAAARTIVHQDDLRAILSIDTLAILKETRDEQ